MVKQTVQFVLQGIAYVFNNIKQTQEFNLHTYSIRAFQYICIELIHMY